MAVSAFWHQPLAETLNRTRQLLDTRWISLKKWVIARNWDQTVTKDVASVSATRRRRADRN